jgi:hypothetical protein
MGFPAEEMLHQGLVKAGAQRTLEGIGSMPLFGTAPALAGFPTVPSGWAPLLWGACQCTMKSRITVKARSGASAVTPCPHPGNRSKCTRCAGKAATRSS